MQITSPWLILLGVAVLTVPALGRIFDFETHRLTFAIDPSIKALLPRDGNALRVFEETRDRYATDDYLLVAWIGDDLYRPQRLANLKRLTKRIERLPGVDKVESIASAYNLRARGDVTEINAFLDVIPEDETSAKGIRDEALANPLYRGHLVSDDGRGIMLTVHFDPTLSSKTLIALVDEIGLFSAEEADGIEQFLSGPLFVRLEVSRLMLRDLYRTMPIAVAATLIVALIGFQNVRGVVLPLVSNAVALILSLACFVAAGHTMNFVTVILPPVIYVVGFAYAIHIISDFDRHFEKGLNREAATAACLRDVFVPLTLTAFTTAVGFASLTVSDIESIQLFGRYAALGTLLAWMSALIVVPAGLMVLPALTRLDRRQSYLSRIAPPLARFDLRHDRLLLIAGAVLFAVSFAFATQIKVSTDYLRNFDDDAQIQRNFRKIGDIFTGAVPLQILIETGVPDTFKDPADLRAINALKKWLLRQPEIGGVYTLADYIDVLHRALAPDVATIGGVPRSASMTNHLLLLGGADDVYRFTDFDFQTTLLHVRSTEVSTDNLMSLVERINERLGSMPAHMRGQVTGSSYLVARTIEDITRGQVASLSLALGVIFLVLVVVFGSLRIGAMALIPNALPILAYFGILGASSVSLSLTTSLVACVVLGIAVDDSIHFLSRFSAQARRNGEGGTGVEATLAAVIRPVSFTTAALCVGFFTLITGELKSQVEFGILAAATLFIAWVLDLTFTPALCGRMQFVTLWELLTVPVGPRPHKSIPLFAGLSNREARIAALMGRIKKLEGLDFAERDPGITNGIAVVLDGELRVSNPAATASVSTLVRGDIIDVALLSTESADLISSAVLPLRYLELSPQSLQIIRERYPHIGNEIDRNLVHADQKHSLTKKPSRS